MRPQGPIILRARLIEKRSNISNMKSDFGPRGVAFEISNSEVNLFLSIFTDFLAIFGIIGQPGISRLSSNDCESCQLIPSNRICS